MGAVQYQILNKVLQTSDYSIIINNNLSNKHFFDFKPEFEFIKNHVEHYGNVPDKITFVNVFPDFKFSETNEPDSYLLDSLNQEYKREFLRLQFNEMKNYLEKGDLEKAERIFSTSYNDLSAQNISMEAVDLFNDDSRYKNYEEMSKNKSKYRVTTGLPELDAAIGGIDRENENMVIAARTGVGKTYLLCKMAVAAAAQGLRVGFYEGEMTENKLGARIDTLFGHISNTSINRGDLFIQKEYKRYIDSLPATGYHLYVLTPEKIGGPATVDALKSFIKKYDLDILFIDQYSLLDNPGHSRSEFEKVADISKKVKQLQVMSRIPIISVSQMNRTKATDENGKEADPDPTQIANSDRIGQDATSILMLQVKDGVLTIHISKCRDGSSVRKLKYQIDFNRGSFTYIPVEGDGIATAADFENIEKSYEVNEDGPKEFVLDPDLDTPF